MSERRRGIPLSGQVVNVAPLLVLWGVGLAVLVLAGLQRATPVEALFLDANHLAGVPWYTGVLSDLGILGWSVGACAAAGGAWLAAKLGRASAAVFLASGSVLTVWLLADDLLQLHAAVLPRAGVSPLVAQLVVVLPAPLWLWAVRHEILRTRWLLFGAALGAFCVSLGADEVLTSDQPTQAQLLLEDGAKFLAIMAWAQYFVLTTLDIARSVLADATTPARRGGAAEPATASPSTDGAGTSRESGRMVHPRGSAGS